MVRPSSAFALVGCLTLLMATAPSGFAQVASPDGAAIPVEGASSSQAQPVAPRVVAPALVGGPASRASMSEIGGETALPEG
ncbi:MAG: hypothetical protein K9H18_20685, partial [Rhodospirillum sp.]|nr:hypothetical protein [Rhodospirillum sp.]